MLHEDLRSAGDRHGPLLDLDAVELPQAHVHKILGHEVKLHTALIELLKALVNLEFKSAQFAIGDDEEVAAATRRVAQALTLDTRTRFEEPPQSGADSRDDYRFCAR